MYTETLTNAEKFFQDVRRGCCPSTLPNYLPRVDLLEALVGEHNIPAPELPFWWTHGILNSPQLAKLPWLRVVLQGVTYDELLDGKISDQRFKTHRLGWSLEQRKLISSPKIGGMLNLIFQEDPTFCAHFRRAHRPVSRLPWWWFLAAFQSRQYAGRDVANFLLQTTVGEFNTGSFQTDRLDALLKTPPSDKKPKTEHIEEFLRGVFYEHPMVLTKFHQRGAKKKYRMLVTTDPYSVVTMSARAKGWTSCQNPLAESNHALSHRLWANLMDPYMALMEMRDPESDDEHNLLARAILRAVQVDGKQSLYLDCLYGERGYVSAFVSLTKELAQKSGVRAASGRMIPFATTFSASATGYNVDFGNYEAPYLDFGEWRKAAKGVQFAGEAHYLRG